MPVSPVAVLHLPKEKVHLNERLPVEFLEIGKHGTGLFPIP